jgi:hypothetical protein
MCREQIPRPIETTEGGETIATESEICIGAVVRVGGGSNDDEGTDSMALPTTVGTETPLLSAQLVEEETSTNNATPPLPPETLAEEMPEAEVAPEERRRLFRWPF